MVFYTLILLVFSNNGVGMHLVGSFRKHFLSDDDLQASSSAYHDSRLDGREPYHNRRSDRSDGDRSSVHLNRVHTVS